MFEDPIVREVREAGAAMAEEAHHDIQQYFANLREFQKQHESRLAGITPGEQVKKIMTGQ